MKIKLRSEDEIKIFILYVLDSTGYPLSYSDLGSIVIRDEVVDYFSFCEYFCTLVEDGHIVREDHPDKDARPMAEKRPSPTHEELSDTSIKYVVTRSGRTIVDSLAKDALMSAVRERSHASAMRHLSMEKHGTVCDQSFERDGDKFIFHCEIKDKRGTVLDLSVRADSDHQLNKMRYNFDDRPDVILRGVLALLSGNVNYLFEES